MKIVGYTVGTSTPKSNFAQTDPTKADYIKNKPDFEGLRTDVNDIKTLVGDTAVSEQISNALSDFSGGSVIYAQNEEPIEAVDGSLWIDMDEEGVTGEGGAPVELDVTLTQSGKAADAKAVGDAINNLNNLVGDVEVSEQISNAVAQKSQVQIITWEADD